MIDYDYDYDHDHDHDHEYDHDCITWSDGANRRIGVRVAFERLVREW